MKSLYRLCSLFFGQLCLLVFTSSISEAQYNWFYSDLTGHRYSYTLEPRTWSQAEAIAVSLGGHLVTVRSPSENAWLASTFPNRPFWIGLSDQRIEGQFEWTNGESFPWTNWCPGEPSQGLDHDFVILDSNCGARWDAVDQSVLHYGIIELPSDASFRLFGTSCGGTMRCLVCPPRIGDWFSVRFENMPPNAVFAVLVGISNAYWGSTILPMDLTPIGMNGCSLSVSAEMIFLDQAQSDGGRSWPPPNTTVPFFFVIPQEPMLVGAELFIQGLVQDPSANSLGFTTTAGGHVVIGPP